MKFKEAFQIQKAVDEKKIIEQLKKEQEKFRRLAYRVYKKNKTKNKNKNKSDNIWET